MLRYILNVGAGRQDERPGQAEVGEQRLALLGKQFMPEYYPRRTPRLVSCYALFK